ncbi:hypothetical protein GALMADRAFT_208616 [Galerina marginata CBS 339.88]|uniref:Uncharacterized protein n=1 Tax=Galerina marginata (strain CBS 339.88) TaxID=685588 RepID=A0A067T7H7_GALM3|nr:hypothetical protein GALMADRAFT_208616 [Galerina marginata CBS 339.88]
MSNILHNLKEKLAHHGDHTSTHQDATHNVRTNLTHDSVKGKDTVTEPTYAHPAKTNDPANLDQPQGLLHDLKNNLPAPPATYLPLLAATNCGPDRLYSTMPNSQHKQGQGTVTSKD